MKKKTILITSAIVLLLAVITAIIVISVNRGKVKVFTDTNYPGFYKQKDNNIVFRLKDKNNSDVPWQIEEESGIVEVATKGEGTGKKVSFTFAPKAPGITNLRLYKSKELFGFNIDIVSVEIPINITENESGLAVNMLGAPTLTDNGGGVGGKDTDNPYVLLNNGDGTARVVFVKGQNDWRISDSSNMANLEWAVIEENMDSCWISENASYDPNAEVVSTEATEEGEDGGDADSEGESEKSSGTKPAKTAKDIANITISDEEYEGDSIDLSEYMVDGEIPEDVLKELDKKLEKMAKERGEDVSGDSALVSLFMSLGLYLTEMIAQLATDTVLMTKSAYTTLDQTFDLEKMAADVLEVYKTIPEEVRKDQESAEYRAYFSELEKDSKYSMLESVLGRFRDTANVADVYMEVFDDDTKTGIYFAEPDRSEYRVWMGEYEEVDQKYVKKLMESSLKNPLSSTRKQKKSGKK